MSTKFVFVTGGVVSSLGKGITAASLGRLLKLRGLRVSMQKLDPYINENPSLMSPYQHGEVFVTDDGTEADLDLGHYERFIDENLSSASTASSGKIYSQVLSNERSGVYQGGTVQVIPHITNEIKTRISNSAQHGAVDVVIIEIGGTVGDIECQPFLEAIRQFRWEAGPQNCVNIHVTLLPYITAAGELKTKPTQHSVASLRSIGIQPDIIVCRSEHPVHSSIKNKIALFCNVAPDHVIRNLDVRTLYEVPLLLEKEGLGDVVCRLLSLNAQKPELSEWNAMVQRLLAPKHRVKIALVGKYVELKDAYLSCMEALCHAGIHHETDVELAWVQAEHLTDENIDEKLGGVDGIFAPCGFGERGTDGLILAAGYAREHRIPYLGTGFGMQLALVEIARNVLNLTDAHTTEVQPATPYPIVCMPKDHNNRTDDSLRLGAYEIKLAPGSKIEALYGEGTISERHRQRYEVNPDFRETFECHGVMITGVNPEHGYIESMEIQDHPWFVGVTYHPEFKSRPNRAHPLFCGFVAAALEQAKERGDTK